MKLIFAVLLISSCTSKRADNIHDVAKIKVWKPNAMLDFKGYSDSVIRTHREQDSMKWVFTGCF